MSNQTQEYIPFGKEWQEQLQKRSIRFICHMFNVHRLDKERKEQLIKRVRVKMIVNGFNDEFPVGSKVMWRPSVRAESIEVTVKSPAYNNYGMPVAFFHERSGFCSVEPQFIAS